jgi:SAM-dependent methyltransferase
VKRAIPRKRAKHDWGFGKAGFFRGAYACFEPIVPTDHARQVTGYYYAAHLLRHAAIHDVLDLGCGRGQSLDYFKTRQPAIRWVGVDIDTSPEVKQRTRTDGEFLSFDGIHLPLPADTFDLIFSHQVFEHVSHPRELLGEVRRVLKPGGHFVGSVSQLEPYHSYSLWNYTIYGFKSIIEDANLTLCELRPGPDVLALLLRKGLGCPKWSSVIWRRQTPLNGFMHCLGWLLGMQAKQINLLKLLFAGQFAFLVKKLAS